MAFDLPLWLIVYAVAIILAASFVRGFTGFGFALIAISGLSLVRPTAEVVPIVFVLELLCSANLLPSVWRHVEWRSVAWLLAGAAVATPVGAYILANVPPRQMSIGVFAIVFVLALLLLRGPVVDRRPGHGAALLAGAASGLLNGGAGIGGPPAILFYFAGTASTHVARASLVAYFLSIDIMGLAASSGAGLVDRTTIYRAAALIPPVAIGIFLGNRHFLATSPERVRHLVLLALVGIAAIGLIKAIIQLALGS